MGEPLDLLAEAIAVERLDRLDDPRVERAAPLLQQPAVGDLVGERVLEGVLEVREEPGLVEELGGLQVVEPARSASSGSSAIAWSSANGTSLPMTAAAWSRRLSSGREPVDARREHRLDRGRDLDRLDRLRQPVAAALAHQRLRLHQRPHALLQEERVPALDQELLERLERRVVAEERLQQLAGALGRERIEPELAVVGLAAPAVLVLGPVVHEQQQARRAGSRPGYRAAPASRRRSSGDPRRSAGAAAPRSPGAAAA